jgi:hypothetical protein
MVGARGFEPPRSFEHTALNRACLPFQHAPAVFKVYDGSRPGDEWSARQASGSGFQR